MKSKLSRPRIIITLLLAGFLLTVTASVLAIWIITRNLPEIFSFKDYRPMGVTQLILKDSSGNEKVLSEFYKERRYLVKYNEIPKVVIDAFLSAEDDQFFEHQGVSYISMMRAFLANMRAGHVVQGGSTITQQVAKTLFLTSERTVVRKIKELVLSQRLEQNLSKEDILALYLNQIYLGGGAYGISAAVKIYFNKELKDVTLEEAALLAGMPRAPSAYSPHVNPLRAKERQVYVLARMLETKKIDEKQRKEAVSKFVRIYRSNEMKPEAGKYIAENARRYLFKTYGETKVLEEALKVYLPSNLKMFKAAQESLRSGLRDVDRRRGYRGPLSTLESDEALTAFLKSSREDLIKSKFPYFVLTPDGKNDLESLLAHKKMDSEASLLEMGKSYRAVVTKVIKEKNLAQVTVGSITGSLLFSDASWARLINDKGKPLATPTKIEQVFKEKEIVLVRLKEIKKEKEVIFSLDQEPLVEGALFSMDFTTGRVLAMEGGYDFERSEFNRATQALRQMGSAYKSIIFSAGIERGYTPASVFVDAPLVFKDEEFGDWKPSNYEEKFYGDTLFRLALIKSRNIPTIKLVRELKVPYMIEYSKRLGLTGNFNPDLSISLGSGQASLAELSTVYALFPRLGHKVTPVFIEEVIDRDGNILEQAKIQPIPQHLFNEKLPLDSEADPNPNSTPTPYNPGENSDAMESGTSVVVRPKLPAMPLRSDPDQRIDPRVAYVMTHLMKEVIDEGTGARAKDLKRTIAGKTGTTNDYKDAWFLAYTPHIMSGAWVGFDDPKEALGPGETGGNAALPIWLAFMKTAVENYPDVDFPIPPGISFASIDTRTGKLKEGKGPGTILEAFISGTEPTTKSDVKGQDVDTESEFLKKDLE
jgi:penicillin-binding protein 1A